MRLTADGFEWDSGNRAKCQKHGVSIPEIEEVFENDPLIAPDHRHSYVEDRLIAVGKTRAGRHVYVAFTFRRTSRQQLIRPVSARYMHAKEVASYEQSQEEESA